MLVVEENNSFTIALGFWWIANDRLRLEHWLTEACHAIADADVSERTAKGILADNLKEHYEEYLEDRRDPSDPTNTLIDILAGEALKQINWHNIAEGLIEKHLEQCRNI